MNKNIYGLRQAWLEAEDNFDTAEIEYLAAKKAVEVAYDAYRATQRKPID
jgi:hypothetical protein